MTDFATTGDLATVWRPLSAAELGAAERLLRWASAIIREEIPTVDSRIEDGTLDADIATLVAVAMVKRVMSNPSGARSVSESLEDYSRQVTLADAGDGGLFLTDQERRRLLPRRRGAFTIAPSAP